MSEQVVFWPVCVCFFSCMLCLRVSGTTSFQRVKKKLRETYHVSVHFIKVLTRMQEKTADDPAIFARDGRRHCATRRPRASMSCPVHDDRARVDMKLPVDWLFVEPREDAFAPLPIRRGSLAKSPPVQHDALSAATPLLFSGA
jgi:hypothetical protein